MIASGDGDQLVLRLKLGVELKQLWTRRKGGFFCFVERHGKRRDRKIFRQRLLRIIVHSHGVYKIRPGYLHTVSSRDEIRFGEVEIGFRLCNVALRPGPDVIEALSLTHPNLTAFYYTPLNTH